jgi:hypothetical protein
MRVYEHVRGLEIAMENQVRVRMRDCLGHLQKQR